MFPEIPGRKFVREREREGEGGEKGWKDRDLEITGFRGRFFGDQSGAWNRPVVSHLGRADVVGIFYRFAWRQGRNRFLRSPFSSNFSAENVSPLLLNRATRRLIVVSRSTHVSHRISSTFRFAISEVLLLRGDKMSHPRHLYRYKCPLKRLSRIDFARRVYGFELLTFRGTISGDVVLFNYICSRCV